MKFVVSQMFDIRPRTFSGEVDIERISKIKSLLDLRGIPPVQPSLPRAVDAWPLDSKEAVVQETQAHKGEVFRYLHTADVIFVMPNAWNSGSACMVESCGFPAIGSPSDGISF